MVTLDDIQKARQRIQSVIHHTPLLPSKFYSDKLWFKCESLQRTGAFKLRGAYNALMSLPKEKRKRGVVASSSGNHAQGVALAAQIEGVPATIVMIKCPISEKYEQTKAYGATVILGGDTSQELIKLATRIAKKKGIHYIPSFDHPHIIAGQGTTAFEILEDLSDVQTIIVPVGGGGLISGISTVIKESHPHIRVIGVEPKGAAKMSHALKQGRLVTLPKIDTIADGLCPVRAGEHTFEHVQRYVDDIVSVSDAEILEAMRHLIYKEKIVVEPSGAAAFAAVQAGKIKLKGKTVCLITGGNVSKKLLQSL